MFTVTLFTTAMIWGKKKNKKQKTNCPSTDEWIRKMRCTAQPKKNNILPFAGVQIDLEGIILSEMSDGER